jgi:2-succinyl-6-hydroxy-2,4-cyclohexadiene-1-carboxylate synthase
MPELKGTAGRPSIWYETKGKRSNSPLVLLHGFTGTHRTWDGLSERLAEEHFLIIPDLPGHGKSGISKSREGMGVRATSEAVADLLMTEAGGRKAVLVGYSLGGRVALDLACARQELLGRLVVEGASPGLESSDEREDRRARDDALADEIEARGVGWFVDHWQDIPLFATQKDLPREVFQGVRRDRLSNSAKGLAMSLRAAGTGRMTPLWGEIGGLGIPVLIVVGKRDEKYGESGEAMRARIPGSTLVAVEGAGHCVHVEKPEEFAELVERFLDDRHVVARAAKRRSR